MNEPKEYLLSSGIPVLFQHTELPVAATYWWNRVGSFDEQKGEEGFAHFLEHMLFKDTDAKTTGKSSQGKTARLIESLGGDINAYTSYDQTVYHVTCAAEHWEKVLAAFCDIAKPKSFLKSDFVSEREVILEEMKKNEDHPGRQLFQSLFHETFTGHGYSRPVIGTKKSLLQATVKDLSSFYQRMYAPENTGLVCVGPLGWNEKRIHSILKILERSFGKQVFKKNKPVPQTKRQTQCKKSKLTTKEIRFDIQYPTLAFSFLTVPQNHEDQPALDLIAHSLGAGELGRLYQKCFYEKSLVTDVSCSNYAPQKAGLVYFSADYENLNDTNEIFETILHEVQRLKKEGITQEELDRAILSTESEKLYSTQTVDGLASRLGYLKHEAGNLHYDQIYIEKLKQTTTEKIQEVMNRYFLEERMSVCLLLPKKSEKFDFTAIKKRAKEILSPLVQEKPKKIQNKLEVGRPLQWESSQGIKVCFHPRPESHSVSMHASFLGGLRVEHEKTYGLGYLLGTTWSKGTQTKTSKDIAKIIEGKAAALDGFSGRNSLGLSMTHLKRDWKQMSELFVEVLSDPKFDDQEIQHSKRVIEESLKSIQDHSSQLCSRLFLETLFEGHPYGKNLLGSLELLSAYDSNMVRSHYESLIHPSEMSLSMVGNLSEKEAQDFIEQIEKSSFFESSLLMKNFSLPEEPELKAPRWIKKDLKREQTHLLMGSLGTVMNSEDSLALHVLDTMMSGQSGRLFIELREKKSLAYSVAPLMMEGIEKGYIGTYIACSPEKVDESLQGMRKVYEDFYKKGPSKSELSRALEYDLGHRAMELQSDYSLASYYGLRKLYDLPFYTQSEVRQRLKKVSSQKLKEVCKKYFLDKNQVTAQVGS